MAERELVMDSPKCLGETASDFEELSGRELTSGNLPPGRKVFGVPALYKNAHSYRDGLRPGDIILSLDGRFFESTENLNNYIRTKPELDITIEYLRDGSIDKMKTKLHTDQDFQGVCRTIEELRAAADFGDPYALLNVRGSLGKTHWDFQGLSRLREAQRAAQYNHRPALVGLFGSAVCCVHLASWTLPYRDIVNDDSVQKVISENYVSVLVVKPEAYSLYREYEIDSRYPAFVKISDNGGVKAFLSMRPDSKVSRVLEFLQQT